jgi:DNA-binding Lrp family transcriptional regulator
MAASETVIQTLIDRLKEIGLTARLGVQSSWDRIMVFPVPNRATIPPEEREKWKPARGEAVQKIEEAVNAELVALATQDGVQAEINDTYVRLYTHDENALEKMIADVQSDGFRARVKKIYADHGIQL